MPKKPCLVSDVENLNQHQLLGLVELDWLFNSHRLTLYWLLCLQSPTTVRPEGRRASPWQFQEGLCLVDFPLLLKGLQPAWGGGAERIAQIACYY